MQMSQTGGGRFSDTQVLIACGLAQQGEILGIFKVAEVGSGLLGLSLCRVVERFGGFFVAGFLKSRAQILVKLGIFALRQFHAGVIAHLRAILQKGKKLLVGLFLGLRFEILQTCRGMPKRRPRNRPTSSFLPFCKMARRCAITPAWNWRNAKIPSFTSICARLLRKPATKKPPNRSTTLQRERPSKPLPTSATLKIPRISPCCARPQAMRTWVSLKRPPPVWDICMTSARCRF